MAILLGSPPAYVPFCKDSALNRSDEVLVSLRRIIRATDMHSRYLAKTTGLTTPQMLLLQCIRDKGELTIGELANQVSLSQATVTTILDRLERRNFVYRKRSEQDKRKVHAFLTEDGVAILRASPVPLQEKFAQQFSALQDWEQSMILSSLQRIATLMDAQHIDASPVLDVGALDRSSSTVEMPEDAFKPGEQ
ncbi:MAG: MarR family transcriptional regulator [Haliea sp.]|nr:MarR family transcriptional regulator [Haliea sp.]